MLGRLTVDWSLTRKLLKHLGGTGKSVTRLADRDVEDELLDAELAHGVGRLVLAGGGDPVGLLGGRFTDSLCQARRISVHVFPMAQFQVRLRVLCFCFPSTL